MQKFYYHFFTIFLKCLNQPVEQLIILVTKDQAQKKILTLKRDLFNIRFKKINNQVNNPAQYNQIKKSIARLYTTIKNSK